MARRRPRGANSADPNVGEIVNRPDPAVPNRLDFEGSPQEYQAAVDRAWRQTLAQFAQQAQDIGNPALAQQALAALGKTPQAGGGGAAFEPGGMGAAGGVDEELVEQILRQTDREDEPITHGLPFGSGANFVRFAGETDERYRSRVGSELLKSPAATGAVRDFAERLMQQR